MVSSEKPPKANETTETSDSQTGLRWNYPALDDLCRNLPGFGACLMVIEQTPEIDFIWKQASIGLVPNAVAAHLNTLLAEWEKSDPEKLNARVRDTAVDLLVLRVDTTTPGELELLCRKTAAYSCALLVLARAVPKDWMKTFELMVVIGHGRAKIIQRESFATPIEIPFEIQPRTRVPSSFEVPKRPFSIVTLGLETELRQALSKTFVTDIAEVGGNRSAAEQVLPCSLLVLGTSLESDGNLEAIRLQTEGQGKWIALGSGINRDEDRPKMYLAGAGSVLPREANREEIIAAVRAFLPGFVPKIQLVSSWEIEMDQLLTRVPKVQAWQLKDVKNATAVYEPLLAHQLKRALEIGSTFGALIIELPKLPSEIAITGWSKLFQGAVLKFLADALRGRDVSFMLQRSLVVCSYHMDPVAAGLIVRRIQELMPESELSKSWKIIGSDKNPKLAAADFVKMIFKRIEDDSG